MYDLILVDDECFTIDVFAEVINYKELGFNLVGTFYNGRDALEYVKTHHVDAVITDIIMPEFTGLDLLREIRAINADIEVVFLSAHADFKYASFGIDHKIFKYILKPLTVASLTEVLVLLHSHLVSKNPESANITFQNRINPRLQKALYDFIYKNNTITAEQLQNIMTESGFSYDLSSDYMTIIDMNLIELDSYLAKNDGFNADTIIQAVKNLMCRGDYLVCPLIYTFDSFKVLLIAKADSTEEFMKILFDYKISLTCDLSALLNLQIEISLSRIFVDIYVLANYNKIFTEAFQEAEILVNMIIDKNNTLQIVDKLDSIISKYHTHQTFMETFAYSIYQHLITYIDPKKMYEFSIYPDDITLPLEFDRLNSPIQIQRLLEYLPQTIENTINFLSKKTSAQPSTMEKAIYFIQQNYHSKISLTDVANYVHYNPTYLSRLLKSQVGVSFTDYLNKIRILHAEDMLCKTDISIGAIAKAVGYESMGYFYKKFKEKNGCSPDIYRNKRK